MQNKRSIDSIVGGAHRLNDVLNSILVVTQKAFTIRLRKEDSFNDKPVVTFPLGLQIKKTYQLSPDEARTQMSVITQWDQARRLNRKEGAWKLAQGELWKAVMAARLSLIHSFCPQARYGGHADEDDEIENTAEKQTLAERRREFKKKLRDGQWRSSSRLTLTVDGIQDHLANKHGKVLVLCEFLCGLDALDVALSEVGVSVLRYDATLTLGERQRVVKDFEANDKVMVLLGTIKSAGIGLDFTRATFVVHLSQCWNPATTNQGSDRAIRHGQKHKVIVWHLHAENSMDVKMWALRQAKMAKASTLLDPTPVTRQAMAEIETWSEEEFVTQVFGWPYLCNACIVG
jgi:SNF2 family DNA or RNA helicase